MLKGDLKVTGRPWNVRSLCFYLLSHVLSKWIAVQLLSGVVGQITDVMLLQQGVLKKEYLLTHIGVVPWQRGSRTLFTGSDAGKFFV